MTARLPRLMKAAENGDVTIDSPVAGWRAGIFRRSLKNYHMVRDRRAFWAAVEANLVAPELHDPPP